MPISSDSSPAPDAHTDTEAFADALGKRYLHYALATIRDRALPDVRDGLKPVHRRILYAMRGLRLLASGGYRKSAKVTGEVMGNYHPHGDAAIYDSIVRMAQDFNMRYPLIVGQGNFGNIDGDAAAAARYTEIKLSRIAETLMQGLDEQAVPFQDNYDGTLSEPMVLPALFPNILANGSNGIAVGMATAIPPHNIDEICAACLCLIRDPDIDLDSILSVLPAPDFPTGGVIVGTPADIRAAYATGTGMFRVRSAWKTEATDNGLWQIIVYEIPYQVSKARALEKIDALIETKSLPLIADVRDESTEDIRIVIEPVGFDHTPDAVMHSLFQQTPLESRFAMNMNVLTEGGQVPSLCSLKRVLQQFLQHKRRVLISISKHRLARANARLHILEGYLMAFRHLDRVIAIIRYDAEPKAALMRDLGLSETQSVAILDMQLKRIRQLEETALQREHGEITKQIVDLQGLLANTAQQWDTIARELQDTQKQFGYTAVGGARRTRLDFAAVDNNDAVSVAVPAQPITLCYSRMGWIKAEQGHMPLDAVQTIEFKGDDQAHLMVTAMSTDKILFCASHGRFYTLAATAIIEADTGTGAPLRLLIDLPNDASIVAMLVFDAAGVMLLASNKGYGFRVAQTQAIAHTKMGKRVFALAKDGANGTCVRVCLALCAKDDYIAVVGDNRKMLAYPLDSVPMMNVGKGVKLQKYANADGKLAMVLPFCLTHGLSWKDGGGRTRQQKDMHTWLGKRAGVGRFVPRGFPKGV